ncbi:hypothetical protein CTI12_AA187290 [Artemisia annua]|uniref:Uncharacterized protein n=1 Tax=Artemisia annua TaxID=35608 RepID=A0A2U1P6S7_ARTAN|nr:hypothetical protein CTI12_AA187290 [Artemisia annua]
MNRLGGEVLTTKNAREFSSSAKGETLEDTIRTVEGFLHVRLLLCRFSCAPLQRVRPLALVYPTYTET